MEGIKLKNIDLTGISKVEQKNKIREELKEFEEAICEHIVYATDVTKSHAIEEYFDLIQSALGQLEKEGISAEEVMKEYPKHLEKLKSRPRYKEK
jgi:phosphoribosyl-ATP pyrophosphohydrolase